MDNKQFRDFLLVFMTMLFISEDFQEFRKNFTSWIWEKYFKKNDMKLTIKSIDKIIQEHEKIQ